jgi:glycosyltransferase involved in cell wall biosynthesis
VTLEVSTRFAAAGAEVQVLCSEPGGARREDQIRDGVLIRSVRAWPAERDWCFAPGIWREMGSGNWNVIHVQSYHTLVAPLAMSRALSLRLPFCVTFHGGGHSSQLRYRIRPIQLRALRPLLARSARLIALTRFEIEQYGRELRLPHDRFVLIPNGVDPMPAPPSDGEGRSGGPVLATIGRLERYKGHHRVIEALPTVLAAKPDARLLVVGSGPYEPQLHRLVAELGIGAHVEFTSTPAGDRQAMAAILAQVSLVVLMSEFETHPLVGLEAAAARRRLLVADRSGLLELAEDGLARPISHSASPSELGDAILDELAKPAPVTAPQLPTWDQCADQLLELYRQIAR